MSFFDRTGAGSCSGGEAVRPALEIQNAAGELVDLTGRTFVYLITAQGGAERLFPSDGDAVATVSGTRAYASVPGSLTREIAGRIGLEHWWIEKVEDGFREWNRAPLAVRSAGPVAIGGSAPAEDVVRVTDRGVLRIVAQGAPGPNAWASLGYGSEEELRDAVFGPPPVEVAASVTALPRQTITGDTRANPNLIITLPAEGSPDPQWPVVLLDTHGSWGENPLKLNGNGRAMDGDLADGIVDLPFTRLALWSDQTTWFFSSSMIGS